jgi:hypothetical protein
MLQRRQHAGTWDAGGRVADHPLMPACRYLGAAPDPVVSHLKPGAHLEVRRSSCRSSAATLAHLSIMLTTHAAYGGRLHHVSMQLVSLANVDLIQKLIMFQLFIM